MLCWLLLSQHSVEVSIQCIVLLVFAAGWAFAVSLLTEQITRPLQTLANVVAAFREDDYSFRARGGRRNDAMGDLALEINALAAMLQNQRAGALEAMALVERVMSSMQSPVLAFDPQNRLKLLNPAGERAFGLRGQTALGHSAEKLQLELPARLERRRSHLARRRPTSRTMGRQTDQLSSARRSSYAAGAL